MVALLSIKTFRKRGVSGVHHEVAGFSDYPYADTYEFLADGVLQFRHESPKHGSYSLAGKWALRNDSLFATQDTCGTNPDTQAATIDCRLPPGYDVRWEPVAERVYQLSENGPIFLTYRK